MIPECSRCLKQISDPDNMHEMSNGDYYCQSCYERAVDLEEDNHEEYDDIQEEANEDILEALFEANLGGDL